MSAYLYLIDSNNNRYNFPADFWLEDNNWQLSSNVKNLAFGAGGKNTSDNFLEARSITVEGAIRGNTLAEVETKHRALCQAVLKGGNLYVSDDTVSRFITVSNAKVKSEYQGDYRFEKPISINFLCEYPFWQDATLTEFSHEVLSTADIERIGVQFSTGTTTTPALCALDPSNVALVNSNNDSLRTYAFDGSVWTQLGTELYLTAGTYPSITKMTSARIAYIDHTNKLLSCYSFDGSNWSLTGTALLIADCDYPSICALNETDIVISSVNLSVVPALSDPTSLTCYRFNGSTWAQVGNSKIIVRGGGFSAITALTETTIAFIDSFNEELTTYSFDGTDFLKVGTEYSVSGLGFPAVSKINSTDIAFCDSTLETINRFRWDGSLWAEIGTALSVSGIGYISISMLDSTNLAFIDDTLHYLNVYHYNYNFTIDNSGSDFLCLPKITITNNIYTGFSLAGSAFNVADCGIPAIAALDTTDIAFIDDYNEELRCYRFNGSVWALVGSALSIAGIDDPSICALNSTDIAFLDETLESLRCYRFNGSTWSLVGSGLSIAGISNVKICRVSDSEIAFVDSTIEELRTYYFNGSTWAQVGNGLSIAGLTGTSICQLNESDIVFSDADDEVLRVYRWDGIDWTAIGSDFAIAGIGRSGLTALNETDVAFIDATAELLQIYRFTGSYWKKINSADLSISGIANPYLTTLTEKQIAYIDVTLNSLRCYELTDLVSSVKITNTSDSNLYLTYIDPNFLISEYTEIDSFYGTVEKNLTDTISYYDPPVFLRLLNQENILDYEGSPCTITFSYRKLYL